MIISGNFFFQLWANFCKMKTSCQFSFHLDVWLVMKMINPHWHKKKWKKCYSLFVDCLKNCGRIFNNNDIINVDIIFIAIECSWRLVTANQLEEAKHFNIKYFPSYHSPLFPFISSNKQPKIESNSPTFEKYWNVLKFYLYILMCKVICIWNVLLFFENIVMRHFDGS